MAANVEYSFREFGRMSIGKALVGDETAVVKTLLPTLRLGKLSRKGVYSGEPGADVGAVE